MGWVKKLFEEDLAGFRYPIVNRRAIKIAPLAYVVF